MPVLNDDLLGDLFAQAGAAFEVPASGADDIVARAFGGDDVVAEAGTNGEDAAALTAEAGPPTRAPRRAEAFRSHRLLAVAAGVIVLAGITGVGLALRHGSTRAPQPTSVAAGPVLPSTTIPAERNGASATAPSAAAPHTSIGSAPGTLQSPTLSTPATSVPPVAPAGPAGPAAGQSAKIVQTGSLDLQVHRGALSSTITALTALATQAQGFVANTETRATVQAHGAAPEGSVTLQVPEASFGTVLHQAQALGKSLKLSTKATDVTGKYVDLQSRITALQASRQQYLTILAKATTISDILAVQAQLDNLQSQIEQLQGQMAVLTNETTYSTLTVTVHEPAPAHHRPAPAPSGIDRAWHDSVHGFFAGVDGVVGAAGPTLFILLSVGLLVLLGRLLWRRWQRHNL